MLTYLVSNLTLTFSHWVSFHREGLTTVKDLYLSRLVTIEGYESLRPLYSWIFSKRYRMVLEVFLKFPEVLLLFYYVGVINTDLK